MLFSRMLYSFNFPHSFKFFTVLSYHLFLKNHQDIFLSRYTFVNRAWTEENAAGSRNYTDQQMNCEYGTGRDKLGVFNV